MSLSQSTISPVAALETMRAIEKLGGSASYLEHLQESAINGASLQAVPQPFAATNADPVVCEITLGSAVVYAWGHIKAVNGYSVSLQGWGVGIQVAHLLGAVICTSWEDLLNGELDFVVVSGADGPAAIGITFTRNGNWVGNAFGAGHGLGFVAFKGTCKWEHI